MHLDYFRFVYHIKFDILMFPTINQSQPISQWPTPTPGPPWSRKGPPHYWTASANLGGVPGVPGGTGFFATGKM